MDLQFTAEESDFKAQVRAFLATAYAGDIKAKAAEGRPFERDDYLSWHKAVYAQGWVAPGWPEEVGGTGWSAVERYIFEEELARANAPRLMPFGLKMVGPVIYTFGTAEQKQKYLPRILSGEDWWCQGYSEPGAGSDLASLSTRAVLDGDHYIVNGAKTWTSFAHYANKMFCLVRTDPEAKPQQGISFLLIDMAQPGVEVRPIVTMDGGQDVNMVYLSDVKVPLDMRIGEENKGWTYAKFLLGHERLGIAAVGRSKQRIRRLKEIAALESDGDGTRLIDQRGFSEQLAEIEIQLKCVEYTELRYLMAAGAAPGPEASLLKIAGTDIQQDITELAMQAVGYYALPYTSPAHRLASNEPPVGPDYAPALAPTYVNWRKSSIYGGSNEIQRNIIAKMVLGL